MADDVLVLAAALVILASLVAGLRSRRFVPSPALAPVRAVTVVVATAAGGCCRWLAHRTGG